MSIRRRTLLTGLVALAAPAIIRTPGLLMPVRRVNLDGYSDRYPDYMVDVIGMDFYAADPDGLIDLIQGMKDWNEVALQVQATGVAVDGPVRTVTSASGVSVRSGWRCSPGIPAWSKPDGTTPPLDWPDDA